MARDHRVRDNWALLYAQQLALTAEQPLVVVSVAAADYPDASIRQIKFMLRGLEEVERELNRLEIPFVVLPSDPVSRLVTLIENLKAGALVADFSPLRASRQWKRELADRMTIPAYEVDAHNIVPAWVASPRREYAAYTLRPKMNKLLPEFLQEFPPPQKHPYRISAELPKVDWREVARALARNDGVSPATETLPGRSAAHKVLARFLDKHLEHYHDRRNDPTAGAQSTLSPYLHFGHISAQRVALETQRHDRSIAAQEAFLEELIVRRELSDNFCLYCDGYDTFAGFPDWARATLDAHRGDPREHIYSREQFEDSLTHDELWNAAQTDLRTNGRIPGYLRMYWAKKILHWSATPEEALAVAIYLNDRYQLDGHDPNGYSGIAWSIGGVHDRPWFEREIFGKVRYMSESGCRRKFNVRQYINSVMETSGRLTK